MERDFDRLTGPLRLLHTVPPTAVLRSCELFTVLAAF